MDGLFLAGECYEYQWACGDGEGCIYPEWVCDGEVHCSDRSDEHEDCHKTKKIFRASVLISLTPICSSPSLCFTFDNDLKCIQN